MPKRKEPERTLALFLMCIGCVVAATGAVNAQVHLWEREAKAYIKCNRDASIKIARQQGDPLSLAIAAIGLCGRLHTPLQEAIVRAYGPSRGMRQLESFRRTQIDANTANIVRERAR